MESARLIWRPNSVALEDWEKLSRDEQIRRWRDREPPPGPPPHPLIAVKLYHRGVITLREFPCFVYERLTEANVGEFLQGCPQGMLQTLRDDVVRFPADDDELAWGQMIRISSASYAPWVTLEEIEQSRKEQDQRFRAGVRVFREALSS